MKRAEMKSNIAVQSRCRPEGRLFPRRKVAVKSSLLNGVGDFDMELSLAIQESLRYVQQNDEQNPSNVNDNHATNSSNNGGAEETRSSNKAQESRTNSAPCSFPKDEVGPLRDLILAQAELIQSQQEELKEKRKEIQALKASNDALQCRLERMDRRVSILRQKDACETSTMKTVEDGTMLKASGSTSSISAVPKGLQVPASTELKRKKRRHKSHFSQRKHHKYPRSAYFSVRGSWREAEGDNNSDDIEEESEDTSSGNEDSQDRSDEESPSEDEPDDDTESIPEPLVNYAIMETDSLYHLYYPKHVFSCLDSLTSERIPQTHNEVETPVWRLRPLTNMYQLEGTENITDEAYLKRHQKFEMEEKRRKRWDMQRLRELRIFEKQQRQKEDEMRASQDETDVETFLPSIHDLTHIEITESIPVMAFGQPVPFISPAEFELPWDMSSTTYSASNTRQKSTSHSRRH